MGNAVTVAAVEGTRRRVSAVMPRRTSVSPIKSGLPKIEPQFRDEMALTVKACQDRMSEREDEADEDDDVGFIPAPEKPSVPASTRPARQLREFSSEFLVDTALLSSPMKHVAESSATVHDLTKAKLLAYYARRAGGDMGGGSPTRTRASSFSEAPQAKADDAVNAAMSATNEATEHIHRSGSLRAARTQRVYSEPPASMEKDSFGSQESNAGSTPAAPSPSPPLRVRGGRSQSVLSRKGSAESVSQPGVPHFRQPADAATEGVAAVN